MSRLHPAIYQYHTLIDPNISALPPLPAHIVANSLLPWLHDPETLISCSLVSKAFRTAALPEIQKRLISTNEGFFTPTPYLSSLKKRLNSHLFASFPGPRNIYLIAGCMNHAARIAIYDAVAATGESRGRLASQVVLALPRAIEVLENEPLHEFSDPGFAQFWTSVETLRFRLGQWPNARLVNSIHCARWECIDLSKLVKLVLDDNQLFVHPRDCDYDNDPLYSMRQFFINLKIALGAESSHLQELTIGSDLEYQVWPNSLILGRRKAIIKFLDCLSPRLATVRLSFDILMERRYPRVCSGAFLGELSASRHEHAKFFNRLVPWDLDKSHLTTSWSRFDNITVPPEKGIQQEVFLIEPRAYQNLLDLPHYSTVIDLISSVQCVLDDSNKTNELDLQLADHRIPSFVIIYHEYEINPDLFPPWNFKVRCLFLLFEHNAIRTRVHGGSVLSTLFRKTQAQYATVSDLVIDWRIGFDVDVPWDLLGRIKCLSFTANLLRGRRRPVCGCRVIGSKALEGLVGIERLVVAGAYLVGCDECWRPEILPHWRDCLCVAGELVLRTWVDPAIQESVQQEVKGWPEKYGKDGKVDFNGKWRVIE